MDFNKNKTVVQVITLSILFPGKTYLLNDGSVMGLDGWSFAKGFPYSACLSLTKNHVMKSWWFFLSAAFQLVLLLAGASSAIAQWKDTAQGVHGFPVQQGDSLPATHHLVVDNRVFATVKMMGVNVFPFAINRYVRKEKFAEVTWQSLHNNLRLRSWKWDADGFINNQFSHPYHGSLYFNAFRSENFRFWQSAPAAFAGSLVWEIAAEMETPAINDLVNTTLGGIAWGEVTHRLANRFTQARRNNKKRKGLAVLAKLVDPMKAFSNWVDPENAPLRSSVDTTPIQFFLSGGSRQYNQTYNGQKMWPLGEWFTRLNLQYGGGANALKIPFSQFFVMVELGTSDSALFNIAQIRGNLTGWKLSQNSRHHHYISLNLDYDYYRNTAFRYGMQSFLLGLFSRYSFPHISLQTELGTSLVGLAAVSDNQPYDGRPRDYDYGSGAGMSAGFNLLAFDHVGMRTNNRIGWLHTLDGKAGNHRLINSTSALYFQLKKRFLLSYEWGHFYLKSRTSGSPTNNSHNAYKRVALGYRFSL